MPTSIGRAPRIAGIGAAEDGLDAGHHLARIERFGQVVVSAQLEADDAVDVLAPGREHEDRSLAPTAHLARDLGAIHLGHHEVEHDEVRVDALVLYEGLLAISRLDHGVAGLLEVQPHQLDDVAFVIDDEDGLHAGSIDARPVATGAARVSAM